MKFIYKLHSKMLNNNWILLYEGHFSQHIINSVLRIADQKLDDMGEGRKIKKRVYNVMVECLQNIGMHADVSENIEGGQSSIIVIGKDDKNYIISTGNPINNDRIEKLESALTKLNEANEEELKQLFNEALTSEAFSEKGTAGLGLIDIVRRTKNKLAFNFKEINDEISFFTLQTLVPRIDVTN